MAAKLNFVFLNGTLTATGPNTFVHTSSSDYSAATIGDGSKIEIKPVNLDPRLPKFEFKSYLDVTIDSVYSASAAAFVTAFNALAGTQFGFNTKYPENLFSDHIELDTSVDEQPAPLAALGKAGYITLSTPSSNSSVIYVGTSTVNNTVFALAADKSITLELADLRDIWVQSDTAGDHLDVIGAYKT